MRTGYDVSGHQSIRDLLQPPLKGRVMRTTTMSRKAGRGYLVFVGTLAG